MHVIKVVDGAPVPYSLDALRRDNPNVSFPVLPSLETLAEYDVFEVQMSPMPEGEVVEEIDPALIEGQWVRQWNSRDMTIEEFEVYRMQRREEINTLRDQKETEGFEFNGVMFDSDERSASRILVAATAATASILANQPFALTWRAKDNSLVELDAMGLLAMNGALAVHGNGLHDVANALKLEIDAAYSKAELDAVSWPQDLLPDE